MTEAQLHDWIDACNKMEAWVKPAKARRSWKEAREEAEAVLEARGGRHGPWTGENLQPSRAPQVMRGRFASEMKRTKIMYIEYKGDEGIVGPARIGRIAYNKSGKSIYYRGKRYTTLSGRGFKSNYYEYDTSDHYWISGCRKDGRDALYSTEVEIDDDVREEYWIKIRNLPQNINVRSFRCQGKNR